MESWLVAKTKPSKERYVKSYIMEKWGIDVFLPIIRCPSYKKTGFEPLFPTYLFCLVNTLSNAWPAIRWVPGLRYFLGAGQEIVPVSEELIAHIKQRVSWWNESRYEPRFAIGEQVVVTSGPFSGLEGIFQRYIPARQRCEVLLQILGRLTKVEFPAETIMSGSRYLGLTLAT